MVTQVVWYSLLGGSVRFGFAVLIGGLFWLGSMVIAGLVRRLAARTGGSRGELLVFAAQTSAIAIRVFGFVTALGTVGVNISALVAGLGLTGFALGFALKDSLSNLLAGVMILYYRPFGTGDRITVTGFEGTVSRIDLRYTRLTAPMQEVLLPNSTLLTNPIVVHAVTSPASS